MSKLSEEILATPDADLENPLNEDVEDGYSLGWIARGKADAALAAKHEAEWQAEREALRELYRAAMHDLRLQLIERGQDISIAEWYDKIESALQNARAK